MLTGCSNTVTVKVPVAPRVDLGHYQTVGLVTFTASNGDAELARMGTQRFLSAIQEAQPGTRVVELGPESKVLSSVKHKNWDMSTLAALKKESGVDAVFTGRIDVTNAKPQVGFSSVWSSVSVRADVDAFVSARLVETESGATVWADSGRRTENVGGADFNKFGGSAGGRDPNGAYGHMVDCLVVQITDAFRTHYILREVPKEQVQQQQTASAQ